MENQIMTTPAQEAKAFAGQHGFAITPRGRRYVIGYIALDGNEIEICEVGGYPAALNAMKNYLVTLPAATYDYNQKPIASDHASIDDDTSKRRVRDMAASKRGAWAVTGDVVIRYAGTYSEAVKICRQIFNAALRAGMRLNHLVIKRLGV